MMFTTPCKAFQPEALQLTDSTAVLLMERLLLNLTTIFFCFVYIQWPVVHRVGNFLSVNLFIVITDEAVVSHT